MPHKLLFSILGGILIMTDLAAASKLNPVFQQKKDSLLITTTEGTLPISLKCPMFTIDGGSFGGTPAVETSENLKTEHSMTLHYKPIYLGQSGSLEVDLHLQWSPDEGIMRKWATYKLTGAEGMLKEVVLDDLDGKGARIPGAEPQSYPAFLNGFFVGIEFPISATRIEKGRLLLAGRPGIRLKQNVEYQTRKAVYGIAPGNGEINAFKRYVSAHRPGPIGFHIDYNSWWTSPVPYSEKDILHLMSIFDEELTKLYGVSFDSFCIDLGWSDPKSFWQVDTMRFPGGFANIRSAADRMNSHIGLWVSPSNFYTPSSMDNEWAKSQGYETFKSGNLLLCCLAGPKYQSAFKARMIEMAAKWNVRQFKFDGYSPTCSATDHGHEPGILSAEPIAEGIIDIFEGIRNAAPDTWIETTCFSANPSPWWLFHVNSVLGGIGDDSPPGRVPCPIYRESYTTARDFFNMQTAVLSPTPIEAQDVLGIVHQSRDPIMNDAVTTLMRGDMFLPAYINPAFMDDIRWKQLAGVLKWGRHNAQVLRNTEVLLPESWTPDTMPRITNDAVMPREPYGYAHWSGEKGLILLRNPWIERQTYTLKLTGLKTGLKGVSAVSLYPEPRLYGKGLASGENLEVSLAPYETIVLSIGRGQDLKGLSDLTKPHQAVSAVVSRVNMSRFKYEQKSETSALGPDWTDISGNAEGSISFAFEAEPNIDAPNANLLVLIEGSKPLAEPTYRLTIDGKETKMTQIDSEAGWKATGYKPPEYWHFLTAPLPKGGSKVELDADCPYDSTKISAWIWATKTGGNSAAFPNRLPSPETISLASVALQKPTDTADLKVEKAKQLRPIEKINGVYLDVLEPVSATQGWGELQKNKSATGNPIRIYGKAYPRGLGTHAPGKIVYNIGGKYKRFKAVVGADSETTPSITFEVWVDGNKRWESGLMTQGDDGRTVDIDVTGAKTFELVTGDGGNGIVADHADWAEARFLY